MLEGVTVISEETLRMVGIPDILIMVILAILSIAAFRKMRIDMYRKGETVGWKIFSIIGGIILIATCVYLAIFSIHQYNEFYTQYTITVDDCVGFNEFYRNFKVKSSRDGVYVVELVEQEE